MKRNADPVDAFLKKICRKKVNTDAVPYADDPLAQFVFAALLWESTTPKALTAMRKIVGASVDFNDFRVALPEEIAETLGPRYPLVEERALRLRAALNDIFRREDAVSLDHLHDMGKREARQYLESLDGCPPFVAARVLVVCLAGHAVPVDERLVSGLIKEGAAREDATVESTISLLEKHVKAADGLRTHLALQTFSDALKPSVVRARAAAQT